MQLQGCLEAIIIGPVSSRVGVLQASLLLFCVMIRGYRMKFEIFDPRKEDIEF